MKFTLAIAAAILSSATAISLPNPPPNPYSSPKKRECTQAEIALATGIHLNINGQYAEYNGTLKVEQVETSKFNPTPAQFNNAKGQLQSDIQAGMNIRLFNQQIAPVGNAAIGGLTTYAAAQESEKALVDGLTGDYAKDKAALDSLKSDIKNGIELNQKNLAAATSLCEFTLVFPAENEQGV